MGKLAKAAASAEKRAFERVPLAIAGKVFYPPSDAGQDCIITDISLGGATLQLSAQPAAGTALVLYIPGFDRFAGTIVRSDADEAGMQFEGSEAQREQTAEKIMRHLAGAPRDETRARAEPRMPMTAPQSFTRPDGEIVYFRLRDLSLTGASLTTTARPPLGEIVTIGPMSGRVTRHFAEGIALEFVD